MLLKEEDLLRYEYNINEKNFSRTDVIDSCDEFIDAFKWFKTDYDLPCEIREPYIRYDSKLPYDEYIALKKYFFKIVQFINPEWFIDIYMKEINNIY